MMWNAGIRHVCHRFLRLCPQSAKTGCFDTTIALYITSDFKILSALIEKPVSIFPSYSKNTATDDGN